jgi:predicted DNA-binding protein (MmcQ/YjbR family)
MEYNAPVTPAQIAAYCKTLPRATRVVQWEGVQVFKVGGKMFCLVAPANHSVARISFKCDPLHYDALSRADGFAPAPYLARAKWVSLVNPKVLTALETKAYLRRAHAVIVAGLSKKKQRELGI